MFFLIFLEVSLKKSMKAFGKAHPEAAKLVCGQGDARPGFADMSPWGQLSLPQYFSEPSLYAYDSFARGSFTLPHVRG
jgi:hypothetical protein